MWIPPNSQEFADARSLPPHTPAENNRQPDHSTIVRNVSMGGCDFVDALLAHCRDGDAQLEEAIRFARDRIAQSHSSRAAEEISRHGMRVAGLLVKKFGVSDSLILTAAVLHDVLSESDTEVETIEQRFGEQIADWVVLLTPARFFPKAQRLQFFEESMLTDPPEVLLVKLGDLLDELHIHPVRTKRQARLRKPLSQILSVIERRNLGAAERHALAAVREALLPHENVSRAA